MKKFVKSYGSYVILLLICFGFFSGKAFAFPYGRVKIVTSFPDYKVKAVKSFGDCKVKAVTSFPNKPGYWQFVDSFPDFTIQFVECFPDFTVQIE